MASQMGPGYILDSIFSGDSLPAAEPQVLDVRLPHLLLHASDVSVQVPVFQRLACVCKAELGTCEGPAGQKVPGRQTHRPNAGHDI